jgi:hypothetical protein
MAKKTFAYYVGSAVGIALGAVAGTYIIRGFFRPMPQFNDTPNSPVEIATKK